MARFEQVQSKAIAVVAAASGDTEVVAAVPLKKIRVLGYVAVASAAGVNPKWRSGTTDLTGAMPFPANGGAAPPVVPPDLNFGWFETAAGAALNLNCAAAGTVAGHLVYQVVS